MRYAHPELENALETDNGCYNTLVIEEQRFMTRLLLDIHNQIQGLDGEAVLSVNDEPVSFSKHAAVLDAFVPFDLNRRPLLTKITSALENRASAAEHFDATADLLRRLELWLNSIAFDFPCDIVFPNISISALIKASGLEIRGEEQPLAERVADYMDLVYEFDRPRLFFTVNMRSFVADEDMERFVSTALGHGYQIIGIESTEHLLLPLEKRVIIDADLCEIG